MDQKTLVGTLFGSAALIVSVRRDKREGSDWAGALFNGRKTYLCF